jgi:general secretion pathway protein A
MYNAFFGLKKNPFRMSPDSEFLFLTLRHREALAGLTYAITERKGFLALTGQAGTGKTTLLTWVLERLSGEQVASSVIFNPMLTQSEFLETVLLGFGINEIPDSKPRRLRQLQEFLVKANESGKVSALIVDEAHKLSPELLEEIRLMGNYERHGEKLLQILLIGQSELDEILNRPDLCQLKQRISVRLALEPLDRPELERYIQHRWTKAGGHEAPFPPQVINRVFHWSGGIPRLVNSLSDNALTLAFAESESILRVEHIDSVAMDLRLTVASGRDPAISVGSVPAKTQAAAPAPSPVSNVKAPGEDSPQVTVRPTPMMTLERYVAPPKTASFLARWAGKFGLA